MGDKAGGGGLICVFWLHFNFRHLTPLLFVNSLELCLFDLSLSSMFLGLLLYHPPQFNAMFFADFTELLYTYMPRYEHMLILGDFNIHVC